MPGLLGMLRYRYNNRASEGDTMYLVNRWDSARIDQTLELERAKELASEASVQQPGQRIDVIEHWDSRDDVTVAMFMNGVDL